MITEVRVQGGKSINEACAEVYDRALHGERIYFDFNGVRISMYPKLKDADKNTADPMPVRLFRCDACHAVQAFELRGAGIAYPKTCACGSRFGWTQIKVVD